MSAQIAAGINNGKFREKHEGHWKMKTIKNSKIDGQILKGLGFPNQCSAYLHKLSTAPDEINSVDTWMVVTKAKLVAEGKHLPEDQDWIKGRGNLKTSSSIQMMSNRAWLNMWYLSFAMGLFKNLASTTTAQDQIGAGGRSMVTYVQVTV